MLLRKLASRGSTVKLGIRFAGNELAAGDVYGCEPAALPKTAHGRAIDANGFRPTPQRSEPCSILWFLHNVLHLCDGNKPRVATVCKGLFQHSQGKSVNRCQ